VPTETIWSDYDGDSVYADFKFGAMGMLTRLTSFEPGIGRVKSPLMYPPDVAYYHGDHIGTTRHLSDADGDAIEQAAFTAFGEQVSGTMQDASQRYGYAGAFGYQTHEDFPFLHVGARYYDPASGRFLQRDPMGVDGGLNVYAYVENLPSTAVDPSGLLPPGAGAGVEGGYAILEGAKISGEAATASRNDWFRRHIVTCHPGASANTYDRKCRVCQLHKFADTRRKRRDWNKRNYPHFSKWKPWTWGLNDWPY
jgi:RHS repeat-associated protein